MIPRLLRIYCRGRRTYAIRYTDERYERSLRPDELVWKCDRCGARVKVAW